MDYTKTVLIGLAVGILVGALVWVRISQRDIPEDKTIRRIQQALILSRVALSPEMINRIDSNYNYVSTFADHAYPDWDSNTDKLRDLVLFTIKLLDFWATYGGKKSKNYPEIVTSIVKQVVGKLKLVRDLTNIPWGTNWYTFSALMTRMFAMYEYVGDDIGLKRACHDQLIRITPTVGTTHMPSDSQDYNTLNVFYVAMPRLCSNYMFDRKAYDVDRDSSDFARVQEFFSFKLNTEDEPKTGIYQDYSWIHNGSVASYELLFTLYNFHERVYTALGFENPIRELGKTLVSKLLHPQIPYRPFGLCGRNNIIYDTTTYWDQVPNSFGIHIMPYIGFGIFKTPDYLFYVRVQRPKIAAYITNAFEQERIFALAWVQMPKLYLRPYRSFENYDAKVTGKSLMNQPGLILIKDEDYASNVLSSYNENLVSYYVDEESIDSFIGTISTPRDKDILFWKNKYRFTQFYGNCTITEFGMAFDTTVTYMFIVDNKSEHDLTFRHSAEGHYFLSYLLDEEHRLNSPYGIVQIPKGTSTTINWAIRIQEAWLGKIVYHEHEDTVTFKLTFFEFNVKIIERNKKFVVRDKDNKKIIAGGSTSSNPNDSFDVEHVKLVRDKTSMMYYPDSVTN